MWHDTITCVAIPAALVRYHDVPLYWNDEDHLVTCLTKLRSLAGYQTKSQFCDLYSTDHFDSSEDRLPRKLQDLCPHPSFQHPLVSDNRQPSRQHHTQEYVKL